MKQGEIRVIVKKPADISGKVCIIPNALEEFQKLVGGHIECVTMDGYVLICNEEGRIKSMLPNIFPDGFRAPIVGPVVVAGIDGEEFCDCPLKMSDWMRLVSKWRVKR